jgi:hypothetical protein
MAGAHSFLGIDMIVCRMVDLAKVHGAASPISAKASGFDTCEFDAPFWFHFFGQSFREALYGPFTCAINAKGWITYRVQSSALAECIKGLRNRHTNLATNRGYLLNYTTGLQVSHGFHCFPRHVQQAKEVDLHLLANLVLGQGLERATKPITKY